MEIVLQPMHVGKYVSVTNAWWGGLIKHTLHNMHIVIVQSRELTV